MKLKNRRFVGSLLSVIAPYHSQCGRCNWPWKFTKYHITDFSFGSGCFPLCETCWSELETPEARMPFYKALANSWAGHYPLDFERHETDWEMIQSAVMEGK